jgi:hypothetical protein
MNMTTTYISGAEATNAETPFQAARNPEKSARPMGAIDTYRVSFMKFVASRERHERG